jgi:membrane fusion protein, multidrug efflux system
MKPWQKRLLWGAVALVVIGLLAWPKLRGSDGPGGASAAPAGGGPGGGGGGRALPVSAYVVEPVSMSDRIRATGSLLADEQVDLSAEVSGRVTRINFREGSRVQRGQLLLQINDAELQAQRQRLRYRIELAETREQRQRRLLEIGGASQDEYDGAAGELNVLRAELALTDAQIARTRLHAPFSGVIGLRQVSEGAYVSPQTRIATLQALSPMKVEFAVPERYTGRIRIGSVVTFGVAGSPGTYRGEVYAVEPRVDRDTRQLLVRARVPNPEGTLLPGAFADVELVVEEQPNALPVPAMAIVPELGGTRVWTVRDGRANPVAVEIGMRTDEAVQVLSGLVPGDTVLVTGLQTVRPGQAVRVQELTALSGRAAGASAPPAATSADLAAVPADR